jgi:hypothetical protein
MATNRQVVDKIRDPPELVASLEFIREEQRLFATAAASEKRLNGRFHKVFTEIMATLSSTLIT